MFLSASQTRVIQSVALFDLVMTALFATPLTAPWFIKAVYGLESLLWNPAAVAPVFSSLQWLMVTLAGSLGVLWAIVRWRQPTLSLARADAFARCWVAGLIVYYVLAGDAPGVLLAFVATELGGALLQFRAARRRW